MSWEVQSTPHFDRSVKKLKPDLSVLVEASRILSSNPFAPPARKLTAVKPEEGNYRLRIGRWRVRYSVHGATVVLYELSLRREDTY